MRQSQIARASKIAGVILALGAVGGVGATIHTTGQVAQQREIQEISQQAASDIRNSSLGLTNDVRAYTSAGEQYYLDSYWNELNVDKHQPKAIERLKEINTPEEELALLEEASANSGALVNTETAAMRLTLEASGVAPAQMPEAVAGFELPPPSSRP